MDPGRHRRAGGMRRRLRRIRLALRRCARECMAGMVGLIGHIPDDLVELVSAIPGPPSLPVGHPERAVPDVPPSPVEQELWADLIGHGRY